MKTDLFQSCGHFWVLQICWHIECSTFTASSFSSTGIPSPLLALFTVMLPKAHLTSHSRMSGSRCRWSGARNLGVPLETRPDSPGGSGMQPRDHCLPMGGILGPRHMPRWGLFGHAVTRAQPPAFPCSTNGRLGFLGPTQEEAWNPRRNSRIPPQLEKKHLVPSSSQDEALARYSFSRKWLP